jgi:DNA mismatch repair protein MSH5
VAGHAFSNNDRSKQTLSIFGTFPLLPPILQQADPLGLLNTCATTAGKRLFHTWHLRPLLSLQEIADRHDAVECLAAPDNSHSAKIIKKHMGEVKNVCRVMRLLRKGDGKVKDWNTLTKVSKHLCLLPRNERR